MSAPALALAMAVASAPGEPPALALYTSVDPGVQARADVPAGEPSFAFLLGVRAGLKVDLFRVGASIRGVFAPSSGVDLGGELGVDLFQVKLERRFDVGLSVPVAGYARLVPSRAQPWSALVLAGLSVRILGVNVTVMGGPELALPAVRGVLEARLGVDLLELVGFLTAG